MIEMYHYPVMYKEVLKFLDMRKKNIAVDCTLGLGSHSYKLLQEMPKTAHLIGIDKDQESLNVANERLKSFEGRFSLVKDDFVHLDNVLKNLNIEKVDAFLFDLGISSYQLNNPQRGFSFLKEGPLDMRMDRSYFLSAYDLVNNLSEAELGSIFRKFGEERYFRKIAHSLIEERKREPISTTTTLAQIIRQSFPQRQRYSRIHPATRAFQALRIAVNRELEALRVALTKAIFFLNKGGRLAVISFHSLEDRITKQTFREYSSKGVLKIITKKPLRPANLEVEENLPSRSAKMRVAEKN